MTATRHPASFRDNSGYVATDGDRILRLVSAGYVGEFRFFETSGLKAHLEEKGWLVPSVPTEGVGDSLCYQVDCIAAWSYPYEWCFSELKAAALLTLDMALAALEHGQVLKDASAYNVQFQGCKPVFVDILSFRAYKDGEPWIAYKQFCMHFLAPLALMAMVDVRLGCLLRDYIDGIPLDLAAKLLPLGAKFRPGLASHLILHAKSVNQPASEGKSKEVTMSKLAFTALLSNLKSTVEGLNLHEVKTEWGDYYSDTNYTQEAHESKKNLVRELATQAKNAHIAWDLGANDGTFSRLLTDLGMTTVSWDIDPIAVEKNFLHGNGDVKAPLPLLLDLTNPTPAIGWSHQERESFVERGPVDLVLALALIHHLAISNNTPLPMICELFSKIARYVIVEFVPKEDSQVRRLLSSREDIFPNYDLVSFQKAASEYFEIKRTEPVVGTCRTLLLLEKR